MSISPANHNGNFSEDHEKTSSRHELTFSLVHFLLQASLFHLGLHIVRVGVCFSPMEHPTRLLFDVFSHLRNNTTKGKFML